MRSQLVVWRQRTNRVDALEADACELGGVAGRSGLDARPARARPSVAGQPTVETARTPSETGVHRAGPRWRSWSGAGTRSPAKGQRLPYDSFGSAARAIGGASTLLEGPPQMPARRARPRLLTPGLSGT